jgi:ankyrin repeat protein
MLQDGPSPLHWAAINGHQEVVWQLLAAGSAVDVADRVRQQSVLLVNCGVLHGVAAG